MSSDDKPYKNLGKVSGRITCNEPNLQNIPIRTEEGRRIRQKAAEEVFVGVDFGRAEGEFVVLAGRAGGKSTVLNSFIRQGLYAEAMEREFREKKRPKMLEIAEKHGVRIEEIHDSLVIDGDEESVKAFWKELHEALLPSLEDILTETPFVDLHLEMPDDFSDLRKYAKQCLFSRLGMAGTVSGRYPTDNPNMANEPKCIHGVGASSPEPCVVCETLKEDE